MSDESGIRDLWWGPSGHEVLFKSGTRYFRVGDGGHAGYLKLPADAVRLVAAPPAPRVFFPGDTVPAGTPVVNYDSNIWRNNRDRVLKTGWAVELQLPADVDLQALVEQARAERESA